MGGPLSGPTPGADNPYLMTREPRDEEHPDQPDEKERRAPGGKAAERLREFLAERFGDEAPPIPPDEAEETTDSPASQPTEEASAPPSGQDTREP